MRIHRLTPHAPVARSARTAGKSLAADVGALGFSSLVRQELAGQARRSQPAAAPAAVVSAAAPAASASPAPPAAAAPATGQVTASGAPNIVLSATPSWDRRNWDGPAVHNPYYSTATDPQRPGRVAGYDNWFQNIQIGRPGEPGSYTWLPAYSATREGAEEALRLVRQYVPDAVIEPYRYTGQLDDPTLSHAIVLPNGARMNAGLVLHTYYHQGQGVDALSDIQMRDELVLLTGNPELRPVETSA